MPSKICNEYDKEEIIHLSNILLAEYQDMNLHCVIPICRFTVTTKVYPILRLKIKSLIAHPNKYKCEQFESYCTNV